MIAEGTLKQPKIRKTRSDKKRDVKPTVKISLKNCLDQLSYITNVPIKDIGELFCQKGLQSRIVIDRLSVYFRRDFELGNTFYMGDFSRESLQRKTQKGETSRISIRFTQDTYELINKLANSLDVTVSKATAILLEHSIKNSNLLNSFMKLYLHDHLDSGRMKELKEALKYLNTNNPYNNEISWYTLIAMIFDDIKDGTRSVKKVVSDWIDKYK